MVYPLKCFAKNIQNLIAGAAPDPIEKGGWYDETNMYYTTFLKSQNSEIHLASKIFNKIFGLVV